MGGDKFVCPDGAAKLPAEQLHNQNVQNKKNEVRDRIVGDVQGFSEEEESNMNEIVQSLNNIEGGDIASLGQQAGGQRQQELLTGPIISWERFLPVRTLKVLLVESDNSTRQVVTALLRNCSYEVTAVADGLQAWKILEDLTNHIDIILTEVLMPCLSGIDLLSKIMNHKTCKNIPVIMMSSNDSMGIVFNCLSKGAVDFLVKPIRKNELKNLWQHVWRKCHSSSGSGSESGIQTQKSVKSKNADGSENNSDSNDDNDDNGSTGLHARDGSDDGSGSQSSWTKRAVEVESSKRISPSDQLAEPPVSTCAQVIHAKPDGPCNDWVAMPGIEHNKEHKEPADYVMGKDLEIGVARKPNMEFETCAAEKVGFKAPNTNVENFPGSNRNNEFSLGLGSKNSSKGKKPQAVDLIGTIPGSSDLRPFTGLNQVLDGVSMVLEGNERNGDGSADVPSLELSLKRPRSIFDGVTASNDNRKVLRRSEHSAFSRYHTSASNQAPTGYGGSSPLENSSEAIRAESTYNAIFSSSADPMKQGSNGSSNNNDMGSTAKNIFTKPMTNKEKAPSTSKVKFSQTSSAFQPVQLRASINQQVEKIEPKTVAATIEERGIQQQVHLHCNYYSHYHAHLHRSQKQKQQQPLHERDGLSVKDIPGTDPQFGSYTFVLPVEGNSANYSINGSNSGSNQGSNGHNGSSHAIKVGGTNIESASGGIADRSGSGGGNGSGSGSASGVYQHRFAQREAALQKFRQKRKERNFGKKVRYQSRKRLAEQRPRVRGQFVRRNVREQTNGEAGKSAS